MRTILTAAAILALAGCGTAATKTPPPAASTTARPAVKLDAYARQACAKLDSAVDKRSNGDPSGANLDEFDAVTAARQSVAPGMKELAVDDGAATAGKLRSWCYTNAPS